MYIHRNRHLLNIQRNTHISTSHAASKHLLGMLTVCMRASAITHVCFFENHIFHRLSKYEITSAHMANKKSAAYAAWEEVMQCALQQHST